MILATVSKVEDIINSLGSLRFSGRAMGRAIPPPGPGRPDHRMRCVSARIAKWACRRNAALVRCVLGWGLAAARRRELKALTGHLFFAFARGHRGMPAACGRRPPLRE